MSDITYKPTFKVTQMMSATAASKRFGALRERAQLEPQAILEHNEIDAVLLSYSDYESMYDELQKLRSAHAPAGRVATERVTSSFFGNRGAAE